MWRGPMPNEQRSRSAPSPTRPGLARVASYRAQVGQARLALGEGWGGGWCSEDKDGATCEGIALPPPPTPPHKGEGSAPRARQECASSTTEQARDLAFR